MRLKTGRDGRQKDEMEDRRRARWKKEKGEAEDKRKSSNRETREKGGCGRQRENDAECGPEQLSR